MSSGFFGLLLWNAGRSYNFDEAVTVGNFVANPNFFEALTDQIVFNNQPALTAVNWCVYRLGGTSEIWQRLPSAMAATACIFVCVRYVRSRDGRALAACAVFIASPLFLDLARQARGYSLFALFTTLSTLSLQRELQRPGTSWRRYGLYVLGGLLSHLYFVLVLAGHCAVLATRREVWAAWVRTVILAGTVASLPYMPMLPEFREASARRPGRWLPRFPLDAVQTMFGSPAAALIGGGLILSVVVALRGPRHFAVGATLALTLIWVFLQPYDLYPRFLLWIVPLLVLSVGVVSQGSWAAWTAATVVAAVLASPETLDVLREQPTVRAVSADVESLEAAGRHVCAVGHVWQPLQAYTDTPPRALASECDAFIASAYDLRRVDTGAMTARRLQSDPTYCLVGPDRTISIVATAGQCVSGSG